MEVYRAKAKFLRVSPTKIRPIVDLVRGKDVVKALFWLKNYPAKKAVFVQKALSSAVANAFSVSGTTDGVYKIVLAKVDNGPVFKYSIPGAQGRSVIRRRRLSHLEIGVSRIDNKVEKSKEVSGGSKS